jgi:hypothetical protein
MNYEIRRLHSCEVAAALDLAMETYLEFEAPDYGPEGVTTFRRDIYDNAAFRAACMAARTACGARWTAPASSA